MKKILLAFLVLNYSFANDAITTMSDYTQQAVSELAASPPLKLLKNKKGESRHEVSVGILETKTDDNATLSTGSTSYENGSASGFGVGYGYSRAFADGWAFYSWFQLVSQSGDHTQTVGSVTTTEITGFDTWSFNISTGISYEFLRNNPKHTLNTFIGFTLIHLELTGDIKTYNPSSGALQSAYKGSLDGFFPGINLGVMYSYSLWKNIEIVPYAVGIISLADECQTFRVDDVAATDGTIQDNSPECGVNTSDGDGETDIQTSIATFGFNVNYLPWDVGINFSGFLRELLRDDDEKRAPVTGSYLSLSKSF